MFEKSAGWFSLPPSALIGLLHSCSIWICCGRCVPEDSQKSRLHLYLVLLINTGIFQLPRSLYVPILSFSCSCIVKMLTNQTLSCPSVKTKVLNPVANPYFSLICICPTAGLPPDLVPEWQLVVSYILIRYLSGT